MALQFQTDNEIRMVNKGLDRLASIQPSAMSKVRIPLCVLLDCSGSMRKYHEILKAIVMDLCGELKFGTLFDFTLCVIMIHNSVPKLVYFGELSDIDETKFCEDLPDEYGLTPLATGYTMGDELLHLVAETLENQCDWYTTPVFLSFTDTAENSSADDCGKTKMSFQKDIMEGEKLLIEFVTDSNPDGLDLGGYRVLIKNNEDLKNVKQVMRILRFVSSTSVKQGDSPRNRPLKSDRKAYNSYMSAMLLFNFRVLFENFNAE